MGLVWWTTVRAVASLEQGRKEEGQDPVWVLYNFPGAAATNSRPLGMSCSSRGRMSGSKVRQGDAPSEDSGGESFLPLPAPGASFPPPCLCPLLSFIRTLLLGLGLSPLQGDLTPVLNLITSAKTLFPRRSHSEVLGRCEWAGEGGVHNATNYMF